VVDLPSGFFATTRVRHFGDVPLVEDNSFNAGETTLVSLGVGYQQPAYKLELEVFNLLDSKRYDIAYNYAYRTKRDVAMGTNVDGRNDIIMHPVEPQMMRGTVMVKF
jgi:hypothetical protein